MRRSVRLALIAALLFLACVIAAASAVTITESPAVLNPGGQITITISGLNDGSEFNLLIDGKLAVTPGSMALFQTQNFNMPFSLKSGTVSASTHGTTATAFSVKPSGGKPTVSWILPMRTGILSSRPSPIPSAAACMIFSSSRAR